MAKNKTNQSKSSSSGNGSASGGKNNENAAVYIVFLILLALLLAWAAWMLWNSQRSATPLDTAALQTGLGSSLDEASTIGTTGTGSGTTSTFSTTTTTSGSAGATGATGASGSPGAPGTPGTPGTPGNNGGGLDNIDLGTLSLGLNAGDSRATVESKLGIAPASCAVVSDLPIVGTTELCVFRDADGGEVQVLYLNNSVIDIIRIGL